MMKEKVRIVLVIDIGTQSSRAMLVNQKGNVLGIVKNKHNPAYISTQADYAEQDPNYE